MRLEFKPQAFEDLQFWVQTNPKLAKRLLRLIEETLRDPFGGVGKPEPLRGELSGWWSKRIDQEHRLVYQVEDARLIIAQARGHYDD
jgi:toxin YoeB